MHHFALFLSVLLLASSALAAEPVRLAILAGSEQQSAADLLMAKLSADARVALVERTEIEKIVSEQRLTLAGLTNEQALTLGKLLNAEGLVLFRTIATPEDSQVQVAMIAVQSGAILASYNRPVPKKDLEIFVDAATSQLLRALPKFALAEKDVVKLSVVNFRALRGAVQIAPPFTKLLTAALTDSPDFILLERSDLRTVAKEKDLAVEQSPFWAGSYLLRGTIEEDVPGEKHLKVVLEILAPGKSEGTAYTMEGSTQDLTALIAKAAEVVNAHFNQQPATLAEAEYFLREAELAYRDNKTNATRIHASAAWELGLRDPRLAEILIDLHLEKAGRGSYQGDTRSLHYSRSFFHSAEVLRPWIKLASHFHRNPKYWRGMTCFWFPEGLDEIEEVIEYYRTFAKAAETDPKLQKINDQGNLAVEVLLAASLPHILICREPEGEQYRPRLQAMAAELRTLYGEMLHSTISAKQKEHLIKIHAAMVPFWANEGDIPASIRQVLASYPTPEEFAERAAAHAGLMAGFYIASQYAGHLDLGRPFHNMKPELLAAKSPESRLLGEYVHRYSKALAMEDINALQACIERMFQHLEAIMPGAEKAPAALGTYLLEIQMLFEEEKLINQKFQVPFPANYSSSDEFKEGLVDHLTRKLARKFQLFFIDHWPAGFRGDLRSDTGPFSYWANSPGVRYQRGERIPARDLQDLKDYYLPRVERYLAERTQPNRVREKMEFLSGEYTTVLKYWPEILPPVKIRSAQQPPSTQAAGAVAGKLTAPQKWSLREHFKKLTGKDIPGLRGRTLNMTPDEITVMAVEGDTCALFDINLSDFSTESLLIPHTAGDSSEDSPMGIARDERVLYVFGPRFGLLRRDLKTEEWKKLDPLTARSGFALNGKFYFSSGKEFYALNPADNQLEIFASLDRTPAVSLLDDPQLRTLVVRKTEEGLIEVSAMPETAGKPRRIVYHFDPASGQFTLVPEEERSANFRGKMETPNLRGLVMGNQLLYSSEPMNRQELMYRGVAIPFEREGAVASNLPSGMPMVVPGQLQLTPQGLVFFNSSAPHPRDDFKLWFLSFAEIEDYIKNTPNLTHGHPPTLPPR